MRIGLLSSINHPLLPHFIKEALARGLDDLVVLCDSINFSEKNQRIWHDRTGDNFDTGGKYHVSLHDFPQTQIPLYCVGNHNGEGCQNTIKSAEVDILLNAGTPRRLMKDTICAAPLGALNVHPGILPKYRGSSAVEWSILNDDPVGHTAHFMTENYDEGPIIAVHECALPKIADYEKVRVTIYQTTCRLAAQTLVEIQAGIHTFAKATVQDSSKAQVWPPISDEKLALVKKKLEQGHYHYLGTDRNM